MDCCSRRLRRSGRNKEMCKHTHFWYLFCAKIHIFGRCKSFGADFFDENRLIDTAHLLQRGEGECSFVGRNGGFRRTVYGVRSNGVAGVKEKFHLCGVN